MFAASSRRMSITKTGNTSRRNPCGVASNRLVSRVSPDSGASAIVRSTVTGPSLMNRQRVGVVLDALERHELARVA